MTLKASWRNFWVSFLSLDYKGVRKLKKSGRSVRSMVSWYLTEARILSNNSGQITVFSAIIFISVLILAGILVDISRINAGRAIVKKAAGSAARSLLAGYSSRLKEDYGLFAIPGMGSDDLEDLFEEYLTCNLSIPEDDGDSTENEDYRTDLFDFRIEKINVYPMYNLSENKVTKKQILEYMKYRAPAGLAEGFIERLKAIKDVGKMSEAYKQRIGIDKILGSMDKAQQRLKKSIDGGENMEDVFVNGFNLEGCWEKAYYEYNNTAESLRLLKDNLNEVNSSIAGLLSQMEQNEGNEGAEGDKANEKGIDEGKKTGKEDMRKQLNALLAERASLDRACSETESQLGKLWTSIRNSLTHVYIRANENAAAEIEKIAEKSRKAREAIATLEAYLNEAFGKEESAFSAGFKEQSEAELEELKELILDGSRAEEMLNSVRNNSTLLKEIVSKLDSLVTEGDYGGNVPVSLPPGLPEMIKKYKNIVYDYKKPVAGNSSGDPREGKAEALKKFINEKILKDVNYLYEGINTNLLPSKTKVVTRSFDEEDNSFFRDDSETEENVDAALKGPEYAGDLSNIGNEADLYDEDSALQENALGFIADIGKFLSDSAVAIRDNIYINEYIMGTFKNAVTEIRNGEEISADKNLHGVKKESLKTFYDCEVEYILHGNPSQIKNSMMVKAEILLIRFGLNTLHAYTDSKKKAMATGIATAVAGWWTGGAGIPVITNLIICGWSMGESLLDMKELMEGGSVPIYKMQGDWKLDIGLPAETGAKTNRSLYFNYHDYLRLFLLLMDEDKKISRIEDLIQLNIGKEKNGFLMSDCNTFVRVEAVVSMKHLFITMPFIRSEMKTKDGRYVFKVLIYEGY